MPGRARHLSFFFTPLTPQGLTAIPPDAPTQTTVQVNVPLGSSSVNAASWFAQAVTVREPVLDAYQGGVSLSGTTFSFTNLPDGRFNLTFWARRTTSENEVRASVLIIADPLFVAPFANGYAARYDAMVWGRPGWGAQISDVVIPIVGTLSYQPFQAGGADIRVETQGGVKVPHDVAHYDPQTGAVVLWVRPAAWNTAANLPLVVWVGNPTAPDQRDPAGTWAGWMTWHLPTGAARGLATAALTGTPRPATAIRGFPAVGFDGSGAGRLGYGGTHALRNQTGGWTVMLVNPSSSMIGQNRGFDLVGQIGGGSTAAEMTTGWLASSSVGDTNVIHAKRTTASGADYTLTGSGRQKAGPQVIHRVFDSALRLTTYLDGEAMEHGTGVARSGLATQISQPTHLGVGAEPNGDMVGSMAFHASRPGYAPVQDRISLEAEALLRPGFVASLSDAGRSTTTAAAVLAPALAYNGTAGVAAEYDLAADSGVAGAALTAYSLIDGGGSVALNAGRLSYTPPNPFQLPAYVEYTLLAGGRTGKGVTKIKPATGGGTTPGGGTGRVQTIDPPSVGGGTIRTASGDSDLTSKLNAAAAGDHIVLSGGTYSTSRTIDKAVHIYGSDPNTVTITGLWTFAASGSGLYKVKFSGNGGVQINAANVTIANFKMFSTTRGIPIDVYGPGAKIGWFTANDPKNRVIALNLQKGNGAVGAHIYRYWHGNVAQSAVDSREFCQLGLGRNDDYVVGQSGILIEYGWHVAIDYRGSVENELLSIKCGGAHIRYIHARDGYTTNLTSRFAYNTLFERCIVNSLNPGVSGFLIHDGDNRLVACETNGRFEIVSGNCIGQQDGDGNGIASSIEVSGTNGHPRAEDTILSQCKGEIRIGKTGNDYGPHVATRTRIETHTYPAGQSAPITTAGRWDNDSSLFNAAVSQTAPAAITLLESQVGAQW